MSSKGQVERERDVKNGNYLDLELRYAEHGSMTLEVVTGSLNEERIFRTSLNERWLSRECHKGKETCSPIKAKGDGLLLHNGN